MLFLQLTALSARLDCVISAEEQPATGQFIFWICIKHFPFIFICHTVKIQRQLTLVSNSFWFCRYNCPANCLNKKGKVWGTVTYDVVSFSCMKQTPRISSSYKCIIKCSLLPLLRIVSAIKHLPSCCPRWRHWQQWRTGGHHKEGQFPILCPSHKEWHRVFQVGIISARPQSEK